jgi:hypothetical protein
MVLASGLEETIDSPRSIDEHAPFLHGVKLSFTKQVLCLCAHLAISTYRKDLPTRSLTGI